MYEYNTMFSDSNASGWKLQLKKHGIQDPDEDNDPAVGNCTANQSSLSSVKIKRTELEHLDNSIVDYFVLS
jgi:hypothetical protein